LDHILELVLSVLALRWLGLRDTRAEFDVGSATGHVGRYRDCPRLTGPGNNFRFALMILGVQDVVRNSSALEHAREGLRHFDAHGSDQYRKRQLVQSLSLLENRVVFLAARLVDEVLPIVANHGSV